METVLYDPDMVFEMDIECDIPPLVDPPMCDCWISEENIKKLDQTVTWLKPEFWAPNLFAALQDEERVNACARVCEKSGRWLHLIVNSGLKIDLPIVSDDPRNPLSTPLYMQHGFCLRHKRFEWIKYCKSRPYAPVIWMKCQK